MTSRAIVRSEVANAGRLRVLMICHSYYEDDARIRREAEYLARHGHDVEVVALRRPQSAAREILNGVRVHRLIGEHKQGRSLMGYLREYGAFLLRASVEVLRRSRTSIDLVQVHTLPDILVFSALPLKLRGVPVVLDLHEAMPAFFAVRFAKMRHPVVRTLVELSERMSIHFADSLITVNDALSDRLIALGVASDRIGVVMNSADLDLFDPAGHAVRGFMADGRLRLVYAGSLTPLYELDVIIQAVALLRNGADPDKIQVTLDVVGVGDSEQNLRTLVSDLSLDDAVRFHGRMAIDRVPEMIALSDVGIAPTRLDAYTAMSVSTKLFEYAAMGKPILASRLPTVERYLGQHSVAYYESGNPHTAAAAIRNLATSPSWRDRLVETAAIQLASSSWAVQAERYRDIIEHLGFGAQKRA